MTKITSFILIAATFACSSVIDSLARFPEGDQALLKQIKAQLAAYVNAEKPIADGVKLYVASSQEVQDACGTSAYGCTNINSILVDRAHQNCLVVAHELIHIYLYETTGDGDASHKSPLFFDLTDICLIEINVEESEALVLRGKQPEASPNNADKSKCKKSGKFCDIGEDAVFDPCGNGGELVYYIDGAWGADGTYLSNDTQRCAYEISNNGQTIEELSA